MPYRSWPKALQPTFKATRLLCKVIEATEEPDYFGFYSPDLEGFSGIGNSVGDCIYKAKWGMKEYIDLLKDQNLPVPPKNAIHCWTGRSGNRDRSPSKEELRNCKHWWVKALQVVQPRVLVPLGKPASEAFATVCGIKAWFAELLQRQNQTMMFGRLTLQRFVLPHPTAPFPGKSELYGYVFGKISRLLEK